MKKLFSVLLILILVLTVAPMGAFTINVSAEEYTEDYYTYTVTNGEATITDVDTSISGDITIPSSLGGYSVINIGYSSFCNCTNLTSITIPASVTKIMSYAFDNCTNLVCITVDEDNDYYCSIDGVLFDKDTTILLYYPNKKPTSDYVVPEGVVELDQYGFDKNTTLQTILIPDSVEIIGNHIFDDFTALVSINVDSNNLYYSSQDGILFNGDASRLIKYPISKPGTEYIVPESVTNIGFFAFSKNNYISTVTVPENVELIQWSAFAYCSNLVNITLPDTGIAIDENVFYNTAYYYDNSNWDNNVLYVGNHLIVFRNNFEGDYTVRSGTKTIAAYAFYRCSTLTGITISDSVLRIGNYAFCDCKKLNNINISDEVLVIGNNAFEDTLYYSNKDNWQDGVLYIDNHLIVLDNKFKGDLLLKEGTKTIAEGSFWYGEVTSIMIPESLTNIALGVFELSNHENLKAINVDSNNQTYASIDGVLFDKNITTLVKYPVAKTDISYTVPDSVTTIGEGAFIKCSELWELTIGSNVTNIQEYAFYESSIRILGYKDTYVYNYAIENNILFIVLKEVTSGDINGDDSINNKDLGLLMQYLNNWDVVINADAADVNGDDAVNNKDYGLLMQYLNNWDVELK